MTGLVFAVVANGEPDRFGEVDRAALVGQVVLYHPDGLLRNGQWVRVADAGLTGDELHLVLESADSNRLRERYLPDAGLTYHRSGSNGAVRLREVYAR